MHLRQLGAALSQRPQPGGQAGADDAAPEHPVLVHNVEGGGRAEVHRDDRQRELGRRVGRIHKAVLADGGGVGHAHSQPGADLRRNDDRFFCRCNNGRTRPAPR